MEFGERRSQLHSGEYDWLGPYLTLNIKGQLYPYITGSFNNSEPVCYNSFGVRVSPITVTKVGITLYGFCAEVIIICICSVVQCVTRESK